MDDANRKESSNYVDWVVEDTEDQNIDWIVEDTEDQGLLQVDYTPVIRRYKGESSSSTKNTFGGQGMQNMGAVMGAASQGETTKRQANIFDLNVLPQEEEEQGLGNLSQVHHASGEKITLRNDGYDIDLNSKPYLGFYDGPKYDKWDERQKQFFWDFQKLYFLELF